MKYRPELPKTGWYTYGLFIDGIPFYIGKGSGKRALNHFYPSYQTQTCNPWKLSIINKHRDNIEIIILSTHDKEQDAFSTEEFLISSYGNRKNGGCLVNQTTGGEGASGAVVSEELRLRRGKSIRKFSEEDFRKALYSYFIQGESQESISKSLGVYQTQFSRAILGKTQSLLKILNEFKEANQDLEIKNMKVRLAFERKTNNG
jgi:hypothetical protein